MVVFFFFFKQKTAYEMRISDWSSDVCSSDLLTDVVGLSVADGLPVHAAHPSFAWETLGVNSRVQQAELERRWQHEQARRQLEAGVTLADPARFDVRGTLACGRDVFIDVGCVFEGKVELADGVRVGPRRSAEHTSELQSLMRTSYAVSCFKKN